MSPYPTVVKVITAHHMLSPMFLNTSGWAPFSTKYTSMAEKQMMIRQAVNAVNSSERTLFITLSIS